MNKKWWIIVGVVAVAGLGLGAWWFISDRQEMIAEAQDSTETAVVRRDTLVMTVEGTGSLAPRAEVALTFLSGGQVAEVLVEEGQVVEAGQPLVRLETDELEMQVARAKATLASAEGQLAQLLAPPQAEEVAAQEASLAAAQGQVSAAVANRDQVTGPPSEAQIASAEAQIAVAQEQHRNALITYDMIETEMIIEGVKRTNEQARYDLWSAEIAVEAARTELNVLLAGATADEIRAAQADVASVVAQRDAAQAQLDLLLAGTAEEQIQAAEAAVDQARVALDQARLLLEQAMLTASMDGTVTALDVGVGEMVGPGQPVVTLSDLVMLEVEVNLDETDVPRVAVGQEARVSVDAFSDVEMAGEVTYIAPKADATSGLVLYPVTVRLVAGDLPVRAGMTADVEITTASQEEALVVPLRAVHTDGGRAYVNRLIGGQSGAETGQRGVQIEQVDVELGMTTETEAEITNGLAEGDTVIVVTGATEGPDGPMAPGPMVRFTRGG